MTCRQHRNFDIRHNPEAPLEGMDDPFHDPWREPPHQQPKWWWWIIVGFFCLLALWLLFRSVDPALAHMHDRPDLDHWLMTLYSKDRGPCCDSTEAETMADPDWRMFDQGTLPMTADAGGNGGTIGCEPSDSRQGETSAQAEPVYCVRLENPTTHEWDWWTVPRAAVVEQPNRAGPALIWLVWVANNKPYIRCFLPGAGT